MATTTNKKTESTGLYTAGMVCGIVGVVFAFIPGASWVGLILGILALVFGITGLAKKAGGGKSVAATVLGAISVLGGIIMIIVVANTVNTMVGILGDELDSFIEDYADDIVGKYADVEISDYQEVKGATFGKAVPVKIKNISDKTRSFSIYIEAVDANGDRIDESYVSAENLAPGQTQSSNAFEYTKLTDEEMENATLRIYRSSTF